MEDLNAKSVTLHRGRFMPNGYEMHVAVVAVGGGGGKGGGGGGGGMGGAVAGMCAA